MLAIYSQQESSQAPSSLAAIVLAHSFAEARILQIL
jgi:hypothetical protein